LLGNHKPGQGDHGKQGQSADPRQVQNFFQLPRPDQPDQYHQTRQRNADQPLAQHAKSAGHKTEPGQHGLRFRAGHEGKGKAPDRHTDPARYQHVVVDVLATKQKAQTGTEHQDRAACHLLGADAAGRQIQRHQHQAHMQRRHQAQRQFIDAKGRQRDRFEPMQIGRLVKKRNAVQARRQPVAADQHPAANFSVASFIRNGQGPQASQQQQAEPERGQREP
jgi:hypothetical protein